MSTQPDSYGAPIYRPAPSSEPAAKSPPMLDALVQETMRRFESSNPGSGLLPHLRGVAAALPGDSPLTSEIVEQMIDPVVRSVLSRWSTPMSKSYVRGVTRQIAEALANDPASWSRIESLWNTLRAGGGV
ncbi:MAG: hypothetical protein NT069_00700 [Planctomycetota bacterium]|nr:hypothetical protein [Planctomycetota bacterium]